MSSSNRSPGSDATEITLSLLRALVEVMAGLQATVEATLREFDLTQSTMAVLWALDPRGAAPTLRDVARQIGCDPSTVSLTADKLAALGLIVREVHPTDGRKRVLVLTPRGHELWNSLSNRLRASSALLSLTRDEQRSLLALLNKARSAPNPAESWAATVTRIA